MLKLRLGLSMIFSFITLLSFQKSYAQPVKKYQGLLWEITKPGNKKSYLYGTMHVADKISFNLSDSFYIALENVDVVGLESAPSEWLERNMHPAYLNYYYGDYPSFSNNYSFYQRYFEFVPPDNKDIGTALMGKNNMINRIQYRNEDQDFEENTYLDMFIFMAGLKQGKPIASLEDFRISTDLYYRAYAPSNDDYKDKNAKKMPKWLEDMLEVTNRYTLEEDAYRAGNLDLIDAIDRQFNATRYNKLFLYDRNQLQADAIDSIIATGRSIFAAVGAAHLPGDDGVIEMLRKKGYHLRAVTFTQTDIAKSKKEKFETTVRDVKLNVHHAPDGSFSAILPDKIYEFYNSYGSRKFMSADYTNGGNFYVVRLNTYNFVYHLSPEDYMAKVDSLLYEHIPGTITQKKQISRNGFPGIEIYNTTSTGDMQRYQIYFTPLEIFLFRYSGKKEYIKKWSDTIFNSLQIKNEGAARKKYTYFNQDFSIEMPAYSSFNNDTFNAIYDQPMAVGYDAQHKDYYFLIRSVFNDLRYIEEDNFELKHIVEKFCTRHFYELKNHKLKTHQGYPAIEFSAKNGTHSLSGMLVIREGRYYFIGTTSKDYSRVSTFFKSFTLGRSVPVFPMGTYTDTVFMFSVTTDTLLNYNNRYEDGIPAYNAYTSRRNSMGLNNVSRVTNFQSTDKDFVRVRYIRFGKHAKFENEDSLFNLIMKFDLKIKSTHIKQTGARNENGFSYRTYQTSDTNSIRVIRHKVILNQKKDALYILTSMGDTLTKPSEFINTFYNTFTPFDTLTGVSVFENKTRYILQSLNSNDTAIKKAAKNNIRYLKLNTNDLDTVLTFLAKNNFSSEDQLIKYSLYKSASQLKSDTVLELGKKMYEENPDNYPYQFLGLQMIVNQKTKESTDLFKEIILKDQPILEAGSTGTSYTTYYAPTYQNDYLNSGYDYDSYNEYRYEPSNPFEFKYRASYYFSDDLLGKIQRDSIALYRSLYPQLLSLYHHRDYQYNIITGLSYMLDSNIIDRSMYASILPELIHYVKNQLRQSAADRQYKELRNSVTKGGNNNYYYGSGSSTASLGLISRLNLLLPYTDLPEVNQIIKDCDQYLSDENLIAFYRKKQRYSRDYNQARVDSIANDPSRVIPLYLALKKFNRTDMIPAKYLTEDNLLLASLKSDYPLKSKDFEKVKPELIKTQILESGGRKMKLFFYIYDNSKEEEDEDSYYGKSHDLHFICMAFYDDDEQKMYIDPRYMENTRIEDRDRIDKTMKEMTNAISLKNRNRATEIDLPLKSRRYSYYYDF